MAAPSTTPLRLVVKPGVKTEVVFELAK